jgi:gamma-glutamylcyclotransferase (GGCT)/AIG2-like uncharacterized protein YtfP
VSNFHEDWLFVYGSLVDPVRREQVIGRAVMTRPAILPDYERARSHYFYVRKRTGVNTPGLLIPELTPDDFRALDRYEETPRLYTRDRVEVLDSAGNRVSCWVYMPSTLTLSGGE